MSVSSRYKCLWIIHSARSGGHCYRRSWLLPTREPSWLDFALVTSSQCGRSGRLCLTTGCGCRPTNVNNCTGKSDGHCSMRPVRRLAVSVPPEVCKPSQRSPTYAVKFGLLNAQSVGNSSTEISTTIVEGQYDVFLLTETWHTTSDDVALRRCVPAGYACMDVPRPSTEPKRTNHGGVAAIISDALDFRRLRSPFSPTTFESAAFTVGSHNATVGVLLLYRPGSSAVTETFYSELTEYLEVFALYKCQIVIAGDFNIHVEKDGDPDATRLQDILASFDCTQHVPLTPTHRGGGTLDLVITKSEQTLT